MEHYFKYGKEEIDYLKSRDKRLSEIIDRVGVIRRRVIPNIYSALVHSIIGQQISTKAHESIWQKTVALLGDVTPENILAISAEELKSVGLSFRKVEYIRDAACRFESGEFDVNSFNSLTDYEIVEKLSQLKGVGVWSAEMLMLFSMQRPDVLSFGDLAILRGLRMIYHHRRIDRKLFDKYRRRFSPFNSVASLYIWAVAGGAIEGMKDYAPKLGKK
ncbi:MAG: DNA-3-methyladenine glycosylase 2 family protein [Paraprevotella sp.]|nr:DNA-3-methyladenine glycosylase 2 family protein [Paraprevotella sp.]